MSEHEIEDLVEASVRVLDAAGDRIAAHLARDLITNLYRFQLSFDCGHTFGRLYDILLKRRFLVALALEDHPDHDAYAGLFEQVRRSDGLCQLHPVTRDDGTPGLLAFLSNGESLVAWDANGVFPRKAQKLSAQWDASLGHYEPPDLLCEAGSELWSRLVARGAMAGRDAESPAAFSPVEVGAVVVGEAERAGNRELIAWWYVALPHFVARVGKSHDRIVEWMRAEECELILGAVERTCAHEIRSDYGCLRVPPDDMLAKMFNAEALELARAWFALSRNPGSPRAP